ncbi:MAG TPA: ABC transporter ATP-binding protein [Mesorhizobium sp.]|nr:ABC transporter ATP-binding protein [Mesorhizobium sp.]
MANKSIHGATEAPVLAVENLTVEVGGGAHRRAVVKTLSFSLKRGETLGLAGESGSGKSMTALSLMGLLPYPGALLASGSIRLGGEEIAGLPERAMRRVRGDRISMIFQEPMTSLNPVLTVGRQLTEAIQAHRTVSARDAAKQALAALEAVKIPDAARRMKSYPHELSGGQRQRVMIAMSLALRPDLLVADEPTTALDVTVQREVLALMKELQRELGTAILLITHDMGVIAETCDRVLVMRQGEKVEEADTRTLFARPAHAYTRALLDAVPRIGAGRGRMVARPQTSAGEPPAVSVRDLSVRFPIRGGILGRVQGEVRAVDCVSFAVRRGETLSLVGESGCGKSTTARALAGLLPFAGEVEVAGKSIAGLGRTAQKAVRREVALVFQDAFASLDPRMTVGAAVREPLDIHRVGAPAERREAVEGIFERVGLPPDALSRYPHEFSGGQRQRIGIARALALKPKLIIADESVSALDVSIQARILDLLRGLQEEFGIAYLFISHDMAVVENISDRVAVMLKGRIVEAGTRDQIFSDPRHPYTRRLIEAVPVPDPAHRRQTSAPVAPMVEAMAGPAALRDVGSGHLVAEPA